MKTPKFKVGDKVTVNNTDRNQVTGYQADLMADVEDRTITSQCRDAVEDAILTGKAFTITAVDNSTTPPMYQANRGRHAAPFMFDEDDLKPAKSI
jgi:hypothetical protein